MLEVERKLIEEAIKNERQTRRVQPEEEKKIEFVVSSPLKSQAV